MGPNTMDLNARIEQRINSGLLGQWYVVAKSVDLQRGKPLGVTRLGRKLVLWRDGAGEPHCVEDYCPHRGAPLSRGLVIDGQLSCRYHGVVVDGDGRIVRVPAMPECPLEGRKALDAYAVREAADGVFVYFPSIEKPEPHGFDLPFELESADYSHFLCTATWQANYRYAYDNLADPMHGCYLHADTFTLAYGSRQDTMKVERIEDGVFISRVGQHGANFDYVHGHLDRALPFFRVDIPYPQAAGPGGLLRIIACTTPIDENNAQIFFWRCRQVVGLEREVWRFMFRAVFEPRHWYVLEQDREMIAAMSDDARRRELLYQHDVGVGAVRRLLAQKARSQVEAEIAAESASAMRATA